MLYLLNSLTCLCKTLAKLASSFASTPKDVDNLPMVALRKSSWRVVVPVTWTIFIIWVWNSIPFLAAPVTALIKPNITPVAIEKAANKIKIINAHKLISRIRLTKNVEEIKKLKKAIDIAEKSLEKTLQYVEVGKTEIEIKNFLIQQLYNYGAEGIAFDPIVLASDNSALPHGHSRNDYKIRKGDCLLFDFGAIVDGYNSDITRTFFIESVSEEYKNIYQAVFNANAIGLKISKPKLSLHELDDKVLNSLADSGYSDLIVHKTGHGLGLDVHEDPYVMRNNNELLEEGMVITIEPGLYKKGSLGIRIEDDVVITNDGCKSLTTFSKQLRII